MAVLGSSGQGKKRLIGGRKEKGKEKIGKLLRLKRSILEHPV